MTGKNRREAADADQTGRQPGRNLEGTGDLVSPDAGAGSGRGADWAQAAEGAGHQPQRPIKTPEQLREQLIDDLLRIYPTLTRAEAAEHIDAVLVF
jgi:hypothetical protein